MLNTFCCFETGSHYIVLTGQELDYVDQVGFELTETLLLLLLLWGGYQQEPLYQAYFSFFDPDLSKLPRLAFN